MSITEQNGEIATTPQIVADARGFLVSALKRFCGQARCVMITMPAPVAPPESLLGALPGTPAFLWDPPEGVCLAGVASTFAIEPKGAERLEQLREKSTPLWEKIERISYPGCDDQGVRIFGGLSFVVGGGSTPPWERFADGAFWLPRWCYGQRGSSAWLSLVADLREKEPVAALLAEFDRIALALQTAESPPKHPRNGATLHQMAEQRWTELVEAIRDGIETDRFQKVVAARRSVAQLESGIDVPNLLTRLGSAYPGCYRFAFRRSDASFVGATPERLVRKDGSRIWTEALAGSIGVPKNGPAEERSRLAGELLSSTKDLTEHALVVDSIRRRLAPQCSTLSIPQNPRILELRHVMHIHTPITAELARPSHILDLVAALHPTPSVGGVPTSDAVDWIVKHEPDPRGWYAGPIGWFNQDGDGEFAVALRCGLIEGRRAYVYAGAGIVRDSDPSKEYVETNIKQQALLRALGVES